MHATRIAKFIPRYLASTVRCAILEIQAQPRSDRSESQFKVCASARMVSWGNWIELGDIVFNEEHEKEHSIVCESDKWTLPLDEH